MAMLSLGRAGAGTHALRRNRREASLTSNHEMILSNLETVFF